MFTLAKKPCKKKKITKSQGTRNKSGFFFFGFVCVCVCVEFF